MGIFSNRKKKTQHKTVKKKDTDLRELTRHIKTFGFNHEFDYDNNVKADSNDTIDYDQEITKATTVSMGTQNDEFYEAPISLDNKSSQNNEISENSTIRKPLTKSTQTNTQFQPPIDHKRQFDIKSSINDKPPPTNKVPFNYWIPFLTLGGLVLVSGVIYLIIRYYYSSAANDSSTEEEESTESRASTQKPKTTTLRTEKITEEYKSVLSLTSETDLVPSYSMEFLFRATTQDLSNNYITIYEVAEDKRLLNNTFQVNDIIEIREDFATDTSNSRPLPKGMQLRVVGVDPNGDLKVRHASWTSNSWIFKRNYKNIQKTTQKPNFNKKEDTMQI